MNSLFLPQKGLTHKGKNLLSLQSKFFPYRVDPMNIELHLNESTVELQ